MWSIFSSKELKKEYLYSPAPGSLLGPRPWPPVPTHGPGSQIVFTGPGPWLAFTSPGPQFVFTGSGSKFVFSGAGSKLVFAGPVL